MAKFTPSFGHPAWVRQREFGQRFSLGHSDVFCKRLYSSIHKLNKSSNIDRGAVVSLDFSFDGSTLMAGLVSNYLLMFDPLRHKPVIAMDNSVMGNLNVVKFVNTWTFASGHDDCTIALWDIRSFKKWLSRLIGHLSPVTQIDSSRNGVLVTSEEDGKIMVWNFNIMKDGQCKSAEFGGEDFWGIRISQDASKMIISSTEGFLIIVHDLDLNTVAQDLKGFYPGIGPSEFTEPSLSCPFPAFSRRRRRNRAEAVMAFPHLDVCDMVSAMEISPQGGSVLSVCLSEDLSMERVSVHDIRDKGPPRDALPKEWFDLSYATSRKYTIDESDTARLTHYVEQDVDLNENFIVKELSFSSDGRLICCPSGNDIKLHSFSPLCSEQFVSWPGREPIPLHEVATFSSDTHVHSTRFSPRHCMFASGCEDGSINWYQPKL